tara:strand:+ start:974 stop:1414 length:441 start_codon:yes stop_codon:yes gene_type:complete
MTQTATQTKEELIAHYIRGRSFEQGSFKHVAPDPREERLFMSVILTEGDRSIRGRTARCIEQVIGKQEHLTNPYLLGYVSQAVTGHRAQYDINVTVYEMRAIRAALKVEFAEWPMAFECDGSDELYGGLSDTVDAIDAAPSNTSNS